MYTIDELMYINDGIDPYGIYGYWKNFLRENSQYKGGLMVKPKRQNAVVGGMTNYDKYGNLVEQLWDFEKNELKNYNINKENIQENIINNDELTEDEKKTKIQTIYDEIVGLKVLNTNDKNIDEIIQYMDNFIEDKNEREIRNNKIIKYINKYIDNKKIQPIFNESTEISETSYNDLQNKISAIFQEHQIGKKSYGKKYSFNELPDEIKIKLDNIIKIEDNNKKIELINELIKNYNYEKNNFNDEIKNKLIDIERGNVSENLIKNKNIILSTYTGDYSEKYNSKDDEFFTDDFFEKIEKMTNKFLNEDEFKILINNIKQYYPLDMRDKNNLYELKSRQINVYDKNNFSEYNLTKKPVFLDSQIKNNYIDFGDKKIFYKFTYSGIKGSDKIKNMNLELLYFDNNKKSFNKIGKIENILPDNGNNGFDVIWADINKNGTILNNITSKNINKNKENTAYKFNYNCGTITSPLQNKAINEKGIKWFKREYRFNKKK